MKENGRGRGKSSGTDGERGRLISLINDDKVEILQAAFKEQELFNYIRSKSSKPEKRVYNLRQKK